MEPHRQIFHLFITLLLISLMGCAPAQASQASIDNSARLSRLESEFFLVRSQINSLESQISRINNRLDFVQIRPPIEPARIPLPQPESLPSPNQQQFERLAI